ncbi:hypothetical protein SAY87_023171 [Trapa incisa]|uniref:Protein DETOXIFICATION n=1 Tax=Trapa incisa TaxID=236973 RepID=A0AAN7QAG8_9MYRT|nr:hypothetical protein SAY87_023171 [Trapa incisa]
MADGSVPSSSTGKWKMPIFIFFRDARLVFKMDALGLEILRIAFPAALALAADPVASLIDTAFIGRLGPVELAAVGVSIAIFNQASRITIFPLVSITTSFVAEEETVGRLDSEPTDDAKADREPQEKKELLEAVPDDVGVENLETIDPIPHDDSNTAMSVAPVVVDVGSKSNKEKRHIPSASTALVIGIILGILQTLFLVFGAKILLGFMGVKSDSPMLNPAKKYLELRALSAPAVLLSLAMQGVFRGFKDTKTPLYATVVGDLTNIILDPILIFSCHLGVSGAAIAHVLSQYLISLILLLRLMKKVNLLLPSIKELQFHRFLKNGVLLLARVIAVTFCVTLAASMAARLGSTPMAAFQICLQVWMTSSLLADGLAVAGQAILASAFAEKDYSKATAAASRVLQMGLVLGLGLAVVVWIGLRFGSGVFSKDANVQNIIFIGIPVMPS